MRENVNKKRRDIFIYASIEKKPDNNKNYFECVGSVKKEEKRIGKIEKWLGYQHWQ